jgi:hypothetical protein
MMSLLPSPVPVPTRARCRPLSRARGHGSGLSTHIHQRSPWLTSAPAIDQHRRLHLVVRLGAAWARSAGASAEPDELRPAAGLLHPTTRIVRARAPGASQLACGGWVRTVAACVHVLQLALSCCMGDWPAALRACVHVAGGAVALRRRADVPDVQSMMGFCPDGLQTSAAGLDRRQGLQVDRGTSSGIRWSTYLIINKGIERPGCIAPAVIMMNIVQYY